MRYINGERYLDDYAVQPVVDRFAPEPEAGMPGLPQTYTEISSPNQSAIPSSFAVPMVLPQTYTEATTPVQTAPPVSSYAVPMVMPQTYTEPTSPNQTALPSVSSGGPSTPTSYTETPQPTQGAVPSNFAVPNFDPSALQGMDLSPDAIMARAAPTIANAPAAQRAQDQEALAASLQSYMAKAGGDEAKARQLWANDILASNTASPGDKNAEMAAWQVQHPGQDIYGDGSPYQVKGRDFNWGIAAALLAPAFAAQFGLLGAGGAAGGSSTGTLLGGAGADTLGGAAAVNAGNFAITPAIQAANAAALAGSAGAGLGAVTPGLIGAGAAGNAVLPELVVTASQAAAAGLTVPQIAVALGVPAAAVTAALNSGAAASTPNGPGKGPVDTTVDELVVTPEGGTAPLSPLSPLTVIPPVLGAATVPSNVPDLAPTNTSKLGTGDEVVSVPEVKTIIPPVIPAPSVPSNVPDLKPTDTSKLGVDPSLTTKITDWIKANPSQALSLLGGLAGAAGSAGSGSGGTGNKYALQNPLFKASLPTAQGFTQRTPRKVVTDWNKYAFGPEASFFTNVPDLYPRAGADAYPPTTPSASRAPTPTVGAQTYVEPMRAVASTSPADLAVRAPTGAIDPYSSDTFEQSATPNTTPTSSGLSALQRALSLNMGQVAPAAPTNAQPSEPQTFIESPLPNQNVIPVDPYSSDTFEQSDYRSATPLSERLAVMENRFKKGGNVRRRYAVTGPGTGRSDDIPAKLSDGEYVIDAETVALLGDGSSKAGADRLDKFRVNIRKHKGRALSKGKFSVNAKAPEAYLSGGRT